VLLIALLAGSVLNYNATILIALLAASGLDVSGCNTPKNPTWVAQNF
jgi:hypothetical protein